MSWEIDEIDDPDRRLIWLRRQGRADAQEVIEKGALARDDIYKNNGVRALIESERSAYYEAYHGRMSEYVREREVAGHPVVSPDYRGPLTETDWWRGITVTSPDGTVTWSPEKARELERRKRGDESGHA